MRAAELPTQKLRRRRASHNSREHAPSPVGGAPSRRMQTVELPTQSFAPGSGLPQQPRVRIKPRRRRALAANASRRAADSKASPRGRASHNSSEHAPNPVGGAPSRRMQVVELPTQSFAPASGLPQQQSVRTKPRRRALAANAGRRVADSKLRPGVGPHNRREYAPSPRRRRALAANAGRRGLPTLNHQATTTTPAQLQINRQVLPAAADRSSRQSHPLAHTRSPPPAAAAAPAGSHRSPLP